MLRTFLEYDSCGIPFIFTTYTYTITMLFSILPITYIYIYPFYISTSLSLFDFDQAMYCSAHVAASSYFTLSILMFYLIQADLLSQHNLVRGVCCHTSL